MQYLSYDNTFDRVSLRCILVHHNNPENLLLAFIDEKIFSLI